MVPVGVQYHAPVLPRAPPGTGTSLGAPLSPHFSDQIHRQCFGFRVIISPTLISFMLKHKRPKSLWTKQVCDGNQYGGNKLGVGAIILVCRMLIKVMRIIRMVPMMVTRVLKIQATMTVATSITSDDVFRRFYPGRHPETSRKHKERRKL